LEEAFDLIDQTVTACIDAKAHIRVIAPLLLAQQALRAELGGGALQSELDALAPVAPAGAVPSPGVVEKLDEALNWLRRQAEALAQLVVDELPLQWRDEGLHSDPGHITRRPPHVDRSGRRKQAAWRGTPYRPRTFAGVAGSLQGNFTETGMSEHPHGAHTIRASKGGGAGKWLVGAVAAVVVAGGGYAAWKMYGGNQVNIDQAYDDGSYADDPVRAAPLDSEGAVLAQTEATDESTAAPAAAPSDVRPARRAAARPQRVVVAQAEPTPEETIGVTPEGLTEASATTQDADEVIVRAPQRAVWTRRPSERRLATLYPAVALQRGAEGDARLHCIVQEGGALDCERVEETSRSFGAAAMRVAHGYRHAATRADGSDATGTPVNLHVVFRLEEENNHGRRYAAR
jgi:hypothetical protein